MAAEVIKEFLVSLGYKVEAGQESRFKSSIGGATKAVVGLGAAAVAASAAVSAAIIKISRSFDDLYYQAQRAQTTVSQIRSVAYAVSQLGGSADETRSSIESFGRNLKWNPGFEGFLKQLGVVTRENGKLRDSVALLKDFANTLRGRGRAEQLGLAEFAGVDLKTLEALQSGELQRRTDEYASKVRALGVDEGKASEAGKNLQQSLRSLSETLALVGEKMLEKLGPALGQTIDKIEAFVRDNGDKIVDFFEKLGRVASELADVFDKLLGIVGPLWQKFDNLAQSIAGQDGLTVALEALIFLKVASWLTGIAAGILAVGNAASTALLGGALAKFFGLLGLPAAALLLSTSPANGGEDEEIARRRADGSWGETPTGQGSGPATPPKITDKRNWWQRTMPKWAGGKDAPARPGVTPTGRGGARNQHFTKENADAIRSAAKELGVSPEDLATVISYETGGKFDPAIRGGAGNRHIGLIQFGPAEQRRYGASQDQSFPDQMKSVVRYLKDRGFKPGMGILDLYSTINAGRPGRYNASDAGNGGAPGTVADKVRTMGPHAARGRLLLQSGAEPAAESSTGSGGPNTMSSEGGRAARDAAAVDADRARMNRENADIDRKLGVDPDAAAVEKEHERQRQWAADGAALSKALNAASKNADSVSGGKLGDASAALTPPPSSTAGTNVTMNQENHISVTGSGDPHDTAQEIGRAQKDVNGGMVRDLKGAVR